MFLAPTRGRPPASLGAAGSSGRQWPLRAPGPRAPGPGPPGPPCPPVAVERPPKPAELGSRRRPEVGARGCGREGTSGRGEGCGAAVLEEVRGGGSGPRGPRHGVTPGRGRGGLGRGSRTGRGDPGLESGRGDSWRGIGCGIPGVGRGAGVPGAGLVPLPHPQPRGSAAVVALGPAGPTRRPESGAFAARAADPLRVARSRGGVCGPSDGGGLSGERGRAAGLPGGRGAGRDPCQGRAYALGAGILSGSRPWLPT